MGHPTGWNPGCGGAGCLRKRLGLVSSTADEVVAPVVSKSYPFAVAGFYRHWYDLEDEEVIRVLTEFVKVGGETIMLKEALFWEALGEAKVHCHLCAHECRISESGLGVCGVRINQQGVLYTMAYGRVIAVHVDPIEKKPLYHFLPGSRSFSIATIGCNFKCGFCQNWQISQSSFRDGQNNFGRIMPPEEIVELAKRHDCKSISFTYTEPTIFFEYALDTARLAREAGLYNVFVTNGYMTRPPLVTIQPYLDAANIDLKSFREESYQKLCKAHLQPVLDTIVAMKELGVWIEVTTLVVPGENDSDEELEKIAGFLAGIDANIPWHISRFHPDYKLHGHLPTPIATLVRAREIGQKAGLRHIHLGNVQEETEMEPPGPDLTRPIPPVR